MAAYCIATFNLSAEDACEYVASRRHCVALNEGFRKQLKEYSLRTSLDSENNVNNINSTNHGSPGNCHGPRFAPTFTVTASAGNGNAEDSANDTTLVMSGPPGIRPTLKRRRMEDDTMDD